MSAAVATNRGNAARGVLPVVGVITAIVAAALALRPRAAPQPIPIAARQSVPTAIKRDNGVWFWIETSTTHVAQLMRATAAGVVSISAADEINAYGVESGRISWAERHGKVWTVRAAQADGTAARALSSGNQEPIGLSLSGERVYWLQRVAAPVAGGDPFPPLMDTLELHSIALSGGPESTVCRLWEAEDGMVLGARNGAVYVAAYRHTHPGNLCLYRITADGAPPERIVGERSNPAAVLSHDGAVYWLAPSTEATGSFCIRRLGADGAIQTLTDWLPGTVTLADTARGVACIDRYPGPNLWFVGPRDVYPVPFVVPSGYVILAAGEHEALLTRASPTKGVTDLFGMPVP